MEYSPAGIPVIDLQPVITAPSKSTIARVAEDVATAIEEVGCFYVRNHGVDYSLIESTFDDFRDFFAQQREYKMKYALKRDYARGYIPFETQNVNAYMGRPNMPNDPVERIVFGPLTEFTAEVPANRWPDTPATLKRNVEEYFASFENLSHTLMALFSAALKGVDENYLYHKCLNGQHILKANFYPGSTNPKPQQNNRFGEHTDGNVFTILATDECRGALKVRKNDGEWVFANPVPGAFFVNVADVLQRVTNDKWEANLHKVVWPEGDHVPDRLSVAFFVSFAHDAVMEPIEECLEPGEERKYEPMVFRDYIAATMSRIAY